MALGPDKPLPLPSHFSEADDYVDSLLEFATSSAILQTLCGGVHILDFFTKTPDLYTELLPEVWRSWFATRSITDLVDLFVREDLEQFEAAAGDDGRSKDWRGGLPPPAPLVQYLQRVRMHLLGREFTSPKRPEGNGMAKKSSGIPIQISSGMNAKKIHEVEHFARYVNQLTNDIAELRGHAITHLVDFGSGQNYLGRTLASELYNKHIVAVESKQANIDGAKSLDITAGVAARPVVLRNKKLYRKRRFGDQTKGYNDTQPEDKQEQATFGGSVKPQETGNSAKTSNKSNNDPLHKSKGSMQYISHRIENGDLSSVLEQIAEPKNGSSNTRPDDDESSLEVLPLETPTGSIGRSQETSLNIMTMSLHSCGNLLNHGLRTLMLNQNVSAVCMIGCCYNLLTERVGPGSFKLPSLRPTKDGRSQLVSTCTEDAHGFPMSERFLNHSNPVPLEVLGSDDIGENLKGVRLNITARMMGVQAPQNWSPSDSDRFFTRHFYRALLQRLLLEQGLIPPPTPDQENVGWTPCSPAGTGSGGYPIIIGALKTSAYTSFVTYVRAAAEKIGRTPDPAWAEGENIPGTAHSTPGCSGSINKRIASTLRSLPDSVIEDLYNIYLPRKRDLSVVWSLMAYSAGVVEALIVVDRWLWLREQKDVVEQAWVEPVFDYGESPRNLCIVGIKKGKQDQD